jgi:hypothetical protein
MKRPISLILSLWLAWAPAASAQPSDEALESLRDQVQQLTSTVRELSSTVERQ